MRTFRFTTDWLRVGLLVLVSGRILAAAWAAAWHTRGDYYASLPGTYVRTLNPVLWNSPDMQGAMGYHLDTYYHGPVQYLTLYPLALLDSYAQIAWVLMPIYAVALAGAFWFLYRGLTCLIPGYPIGIPLFATTFLFFPLLQSYIQREFEVVMFLALAVAFHQLVRHRVSRAAAILAYVAWFKYIPLLFLAYLGLRGWLKAAGVFVLTSLIILAITHAVLGLPEFVNNNVPGHAAQVLNVWTFDFVPNAAGELVGEGFCYGWYESETTLANVRHGLCSLASVAPWLAPNVAYLLICATIAGLYLMTHVRLARSTRPDGPGEAWRGALEFSLVTTVCSCFFFAHYYYLIALVIPFGVLLARYLPAAHYGRLFLWGLAYFLISAFIVPTSVLSTVAGYNVWTSYMQGAWFLYGELILVGLLLFEYWTLSVQPATAGRDLR